MRRLNALSARLCRPVCLLPVAVIAALVLGLWSRVPAELVGPRPNDRYVTNVVTELLAREHLSKHPLDDEISERGLKSFLKTLDPMKMYFYQADIDEFNQRRKDLDDMLNKRDISFAYTVFQRFLTRVDERVAMIDELLKQPFDFTADEQLVTDPEVLTYPRNPDESRERWRKRLKYDLLVLKGDKKEGQEALDKLQRRYQSFGKRMHQTDGDELLEMFLSSVTGSYDPHTTYMSPSNLENFRILMRLNLEGIGAALKFEDGYTVVSRVIPGGPAAKHGKLKPEDRIVSVGEGPDGEMVDVVDMKLGDVVKRIRGKTGSVVRLGVIPASSTETRIYSLTRATIELKDSEAQGEIFEEGRKPDGTPLRIGVIDLPSFYMDMEGARRGNDGYKSTTRDVATILQGFNQKGADAVVLDLSRNGGGSLTEAISLTGLFIDRGPVVQVKDSDARVQQYDDTEPGMAWSGPLVVMTSRFSASASEILAGAIQDYRRGLVVGDDATHGKGTVQSLLDLGSQLFRIPNPPNLGALKITMQQFYRPDGESTQKRGVLADIKLPSISNHLEGISESDLDYAIDFDRVAPVPYTRYALVEPETVQGLVARSQARVRASEDFAKVLRNIDRYKTQRAKKVIPLNEQQYFAERGDLDVEKEEEKKMEDRNQQDRQGIERDFYLNEVLAITSDYALTLQHNKVAGVR